jgi:hypothetical protein
MTHIERTIKEAVEKGGAAFLDPSFWQALGKARGWPTFSPTGYFDNYEDDLEDFSWKVHWHHFIDHLANGKDAERFFEKLV